MRANLIEWIADADALHHLDSFAVSQKVLERDHIKTRTDDFYIALLGTLVELIQDSDAENSDFSLLGNALAQLSSKTETSHIKKFGISFVETRILSAAAFYFGGFSASAYLTVKGIQPEEGNDEQLISCLDLLARPKQMRSAKIQVLITALLQGNGPLIQQYLIDARERTRIDREVGPAEWVASLLFEKIMFRFVNSNLRHVLPGGYTSFWNVLVASFLNRSTPCWDFFPSQIQAIEQGLLTSTETFSLQMPTSSGKTTLCETLIYSHANSSTESLSILLVPYRSLASELRSSLVSHLNGMGISAKSVYGGTVSSNEEMQDLDSIRSMVVTPESLSALLSANPSFSERISLVICDEGHLLGGGARGVGLELLLARLKTRISGPPRFIFISAIVPNIEEINSWLGGSNNSVVRSDYRPAIAEFSVLRYIQSAPSNVQLEMHPLQQTPTKYFIQDFLTKENFTYLNPSSGRKKKYDYKSFKVQAIAAARKALPMGTVAVFAANKRGNQGAVGLAEELLEQLSYDLSLPKPSDFLLNKNVLEATDYLTKEFGSRWVGTQCVQAGAVLHHGDIPQVAREVIEMLVRDEAVRFVVCTSTLAEGVNLPIRTLVLYSVSRRGKNGESINLLTRDIKNLVGRAGRAGASTKGLVVCANPSQWHLVERVARQEEGESVQGALYSLLLQLQSALALRQFSLTNDVLEEIVDLFPLIDGIDATLVELASEEIGAEALLGLAVNVADRSFASSQANGRAKELLSQVFQLRAHRILEFRSLGKLSWLKETGAKFRILSAVESDLFVLVSQLSEIPGLKDIVKVMIDWAWRQPGFLSSVSEGYRLKDSVDPNAMKENFNELVWLWISGDSYLQMSETLGIEMDDLLSVHTRTLGYSFQTLVEQGIALLRKSFESRDLALPMLMQRFPEYLRFGVQGETARILMANGVRHRSAAKAFSSSYIQSEAVIGLKEFVRSAIEFNRVGWENYLGVLVVRQTEIDVAL